MEKDKLRIIYMGTPEFAVEPLRALLAADYNVVAVVTMPDKPQGRGRQIKFSPVKDFAIANNIPVLQPEKMKDDDFIAQLKSINADLQIVVAFRMLPEIVWAMPELGTFNLHTALLPQYRGAAPINRAIINGETKTGLTTFVIDKDIDTGGILLQKEIDILPDDNIGTLHDKMMIEGGKLVVETVDGLINNSIKPTDQSILAKDTVLKPAPKIFKEDMQIDFCHTTTEIKNLVRGLSPYPAAFTTIKIKDKELTLAVFDVDTMICKPGLQPGTIVTDNSKELKIACSDGFVYLKDVRLEGKKRMKIDEFLRGNRLSNN